MTRQNATNFTAPLQFPYANAGTDVFMKEDVQVLAQAVDQHNHTSGKGLPLAAGAIPSGTITSAMIADGTIQGADIASGTITTTQIQDGTIATADLANASVTNAKLGTDTARLNLLTNGGMEVWQRGNGPFTTNFAYTADRWLIGMIGSDTVSVSRNTTTVDTGSTVSMAVTFTLGSGGGLSSLQQATVTTDNTQMKGRVVSASVRVLTATANAIRIGFDNYNGSTSNINSGAFHSGGGAWETLTVTTTVAASTTILTLKILCNASCTAYVDNAMLVVGAVAADYAPLHPADDLARCLRYYERYTSTAGNLTTGQAVSAITAYGGVPYKALKAVVPTVTFGGTWNGTQPLGALTAGTPSAGVISVADFQIGLTGMTGLTAGYACLVSGASGATVSIEANP